MNGDNGSVLAGNPVVTSLADSNSPVSGGPYAITASVGSLSAANYQFGFAPGQLTITPAQSLLTVAVSSPMVATGNPVTLTATVAPILSGSPLPSGTIQFTVDGVDFGAPVGINTGIANLSTAALAHGAHSLSARFGGDGNFFGSTNNTPVSVVVDTAPVALLASYSRYSDSPLQIAVSDLITNFTTDVDGDALTVTFVGSGTNGANVSIAGGSITYTPSGTSSNADAGDYLQYVVSDGFTGGTATNFIAITVSGSNPNTQPTTITGIVAISGGMKITFSGAALTEYHMQRANVLLGDGTGWNDMGPVTTDSNGQGEFIDSSAPADQAFYRIARPQ